MDFLGGNNRPVSWSYHKFWSRRDYAIALEELMVTVDFNTVTSTQSYQYNFVHQILIHANCFSMVVS